MNVLILTISFFVVFVAGMFTGRELLYLAEGRQRKRKIKRWPDDHETMPTDEDEVPVVAGGFMHDKSKHWPKPKEVTQKQQEMGSPQ